MSAMTTRKRRRVQFILPDQTGLRCTSPGKNIAAVHSDKIEETIAIPGAEIHPG